MPIYILNETKNVRQAGDLVAFLSLDDLSMYVEPIDIDEGSYSIFDTDGRFFEAESTVDFDRFEFSEVNHDANLVERILRRYLDLIGLGYSPELGIEDNARRILAHP